MAFAADFGGASALVNAAAIRMPAGAYGGPNNDEWVLDDTPGQPEGLGSMVLQVGQEQFAAAALAARAGAWDITAADSGVLVSDAPEANEHGLPVNFGPGRGNWTALEVSRLLAVPRSLDDDVNSQIRLADALQRNDLAGVVLDADGTDVEIGVHSVGTANVVLTEVRLLYLASNV